ncbi:MAG: Flp pilus assembly complex ATPase component [Proteobacteria bacterium]|nr:Flp pilus assembly complex ATPase component [Pseudomonadota bacterium]MCP4921654.1 Flp pilus assembly complex ATPase component [Pseudomonadota bacterium]
MKGLERLRQVMGRPVSTLWGDEAGDRQVEELMAQARRDAKNSGRSVEQVLATYGFDVDAQVAPTSSPPSASLSHVRDDDVIAALAPRTPEDARLAIRAANPVALADRACFLGLVALSARGDIESNGVQGLLAHGVSPEDVAALVACERYTEPVVGEFEFTDHALGERLVRFRELHELRAEARVAGAALWSHAVAKGRISPEDWRDTVSTYVDLPIAKAPSRFSKASLSSIHRGWVAHFDMVPIRTRKDTVVVAVAGTLPQAIADRLETAHGGRISYQIASTDQLDGWRQRWLDAAPEDAAPAPIPPAPSAWVLDPAVLKRSAVHIVDALLSGAVQARATDLHFEPGEQGGRVRFRIDGTCQEILELPRKKYDEVVSRIKVMGDMDVTERRLPQDGHIRLELDGVNQNVRIASVPASTGEKVALRLADTNRVSANLDSLGLSDHHLGLLRELIERPFGMILATGPVGSGKTTSLYSCLSELDRENENVMSIEDPVEVDLEGVTQLEVNYTIGFDFVAGLRALLRQDPNVILVGEIRDEETARITVRASMTGLRVFSTLHTNDSTGAVTALRNFHLSSHLLASSIQGVVAQRLLRRLCPHCRQAHKLTDADKALLGMSGRVPAGFKAYDPVGCAHCLGTGYRGRVGIFEIFPVDRTIREMVLDEASEGAIRDRAIADGLVSLQDDGRTKVGAGLTSLAEFRRVLNF